jgi:hypothetical protein
MELSGTIYTKDAPLFMNGTGSTIESLIIVNSATINGNGNLGVNYDASANAAPPGGKPFWVPITPECKMRRARGPRQDAAILDGCGP